MKNYFQVKNEKANGPVANEAAEEICSANAYPETDIFEYCVLKAFDCLYFSELQSPNL